MKIRANRAELADALAWVAQAISKRPVNPALAGVQLQACDGEVSLFAFDYEASHSARVAVDVQGDGECLVSGHFLREVVGALKGPTVELVLNGPRLEIQAGRSTYRVSTLNSDDFPTLPAFPAVRGEVARDDLADVLGTIEHAASRDQMLAILTAAHLVGSAEGIAATTTDRFRIAHREASWSSGGGVFEANVPIAALTAGLKGMSGPITVGHEGGIFGIADSRRKVTTRCLDAQFPKVEQFLGLDADEAVEVDAADLAGAVKRAVMASPEHQIVRLAISGQEITVTADSDSSEAAEYVTCEAGAERTVIFNGGYLAAALLAAGTERVRLGFAGGPNQNRPVAVTPIGGGRVNLLVMPRRAS